MNERKNPLDRHSFYKPCKKLILQEYGILKGCRIWEEAGEELSRMTAQNPKLEEHNGAMVVPAVALYKTLEAHGQDAERVLNSFGDQMGERFAKIVHGITSIPGADKLIWNDSEGMTGNTALSRLKDAEAEDAAEAKRFVGRWGCGRATIDITDRGDDGYNVRITWGSSAAENAEWVMSGKFDPETLTVAYTDCVKTVYVWNEQGEIDSETVEYENGEGTITFTDGEALSLTWDDAQEHIADGTVFEYASLAG